MKHLLNSWECTKVSYLVSEWNNKEQTQISHWDWIMPHVVTLVGITTTAFISNMKSYIGRCWGTLFFKYFILYTLEDSWNNLPDVYLCWEAPPWIKVKDQSFDLSVLFLACFFLKVCLEGSPRHPTRISKWNYILSRANECHSLKHGSIGHAALLWNLCWFIIWYPIGYTKYTSNLPNEI